MIGPLRLNLGVDGEYFQQMILESCGTEPVVYIVFLPLFSCSRPTSVVSLAHLFFLIDS